MDHVACCSKCTQFPQNLIINKCKTVTSEITCLSKTCYMNVGFIAFSNGTDKKAFVLIKIFGHNFVFLMGFLSASVSNLIFVII